MARVLFQAKFGRITPGAGGLMVPQRERGVVQLIKDDDDCTRFQWFDATTNKVELDLLIFGEAAQFVNIPDKKGVFYLEFKETNTRHLFWSQEATSTPEFFANIARSINNILDETARSWSSQDEPMTPSSAAIEGDDDGDDDGDYDDDEDDDEELKKAIYLSMMADQNQAAAAPSPAPQSAASSSAFVQPDFLRALLSNASQQVQGKKKEPKLSDILDAEHLRSRLVGMSEEEVKSLVQHLPEGHTTLTDILDVIHSAQFQQAVDSFHGAMLSGELHSICLQCGLDPSKAVGNSVIEAFLNALQFQVKNNK